MPIFNVENGCASASVAVQQGWKDILSGQSEVVVAIGAEKMYHPEKSNQDTLTHMAMAEPREGYEDWLALLKTAAEEIGETFEFGNVQQELSSRRTVPSSSGLSSFSERLRVAVSPLDVSASDLRRRIARGASVRYLVPDAVIHYIEKHRLYEEED